MTFATGSLLGPYQVDSLIAKGGMGEVYRARDTRLNRNVALKVLPPSFMADSERLSRFTQEARTTALLNHPNIVAIYDVGSHAGVPFVVSELLQGETLRARLREGALPIKVAVHNALEIARGLVAAHQLGIAHRDLKPENIFITRDARVKILDFGLAKCASDIFRPESDSSISTKPGTLLGTVGYMSPEQVRGLSTDHRSDIFSLGVIAYEMVSGAAPFRADSSVETMHAILKEDPPPLRHRDGRIPAEAERIIQHCLEKNPDVRFQDARDLIFTLEMALQSARRHEQRQKKHIASAPAKRRWFAALRRLM